MTERTLYEQIEWNRRLTALVIVAFNAFVVVASYLALVVLWGQSPDYLLLVLAFLAVASLLAYFSGDSLIRGTLRPTPLSRGLFPKFDEALDEMCLAAGLPRPKVYVLPTANLNAMVVGRNSENASLVVTMGCLQDMEEDELRGVVAHELAHILNHDISFNSLVATLVGAGVLLAGLLKAIIVPAEEELAISGKKAAVQQLAVGQIEMLAYAFVILLPLVVFFFGGRLIQFFYSRQREFQADAIAVELTRNPEDVIKALRKLEARSNVVRNVSTAIGHMFTMPPENWMKTPLLETHPSTQQRIDRVRSSVSLPVEMPEEAARQAEEALGDEAAGPVEREEVT